MGRRTRGYLPQRPDFAGTGSMLGGVGESERMSEVVLRTKKVRWVPNIGFWLKNRGGATGQSCRIPAFSAVGIEVRHPGCRSSISRCRTSRNCCKRRMQRATKQEGIIAADGTDRHGRRIAVDLLRFLSVSVHLVRGYSFTKRGSAAAP